MHNFLTGLLGFNHRETQSKELDCNISNRAMTPDQHLGSSSVQSSKRKRNVYDNNVLYFRKCSELEDQISSLKRINRFLVKQLVHFNEHCRFIPNERSSDYDSEPNEDILQCEEDYFKANQIKTVQESLKVFNDLLDQHPSLLKLKKRILGSISSVENGVKFPEELELVERILQISNNALINITTQTKTSHKVPKKQKREMRSVNASFETDKIFREADLLSFIDEQHFHQKGAIIHRSKWDRWGEDLEGYHGQSESDSESSLSTLMERHYQQKR